MLVAAKAPPPPEVGTEDPVFTVALIPHYHNLYTVGTGRKTRMK